MPAKPISLGPLHFEKRGDAVAYLKDMLHRYDVGDRVNVQDAVILQAALEHHPNAAAKLAAASETLVSGVPTLGQSVFG